MYAHDRDALLCDLAETYQVFDLRSIPVPTLAALARGLDDDSRIKRSMNGLTVRHDALLQAAAVDRLSMLVWMQSKDGARGRNRPPSIVAALTRQSAKYEKPLGYDSPEAFHAARAKILGGGEDAGRD